MTEREINEIKKMIYTGVEPDEILEQINAAKHELELESQKTADKNRKEVRHNAAEAVAKYVKALIPEGETDIATTTKEIEETFKEMEKLVFNEDPMGLLKILMMR